MLQSYQSCFRTFVDLKLLKCLYEPIEVQLELSLGEETLDDPLSEFRTSSMETTFVSEIP